MCCLSIKTSIFGLDDVVVVIDETDEVVVVSDDKVVLKGFRNLRSLTVILSLQSGDSGEFTEGGKRNFRMGEDSIVLFDCLIVGIFFDIVFLLSWRWSSVSAGWSHHRTPELIFIEICFVTSFSLTST